VTVIQQAPAATVRTPSPIKHFVKIVAVYLLVGPPVGGVVLWILTTTAEILRGRIPLSDIIPMFLTVIVFSYPAGAPFALLAGIIDAVAAIWLRYTSILVPVIAGCIATAASGAVTYWTMWNAYGSFVWREVVSALTVTLLVSLVAALVCWRLTRRFARMA
jgi:hypothetical protein